MNRTSQSIKLSASRIDLATVGGKLKARFQQDTLMRNVVSIMGTELSTRASRIIAMIFVARTLSPEMFGLAALALSAHEMIKVLTQNGVFQMIIKARDEDLEAICARADQLNFVVCWLTALLQIIAGIIMWQIMDAPVILMMSAALSVIFVIMPFGLVHLALSSRANDLHIFSRIVHRQTTLENGLTLALALGGAGAWALVLPRALSMPLWLFGARRSHAWKRARDVKPYPIGPFRDYCLPLLASEGLKAARAHLDKALIVALLGVEALGIYFFAMNAGLGLSLTLGKAVSTCLMPHLCNKAREGQSVWESWSRLVPILMVSGFAIFTLQAAAAFYYVPLLYGEQWTQSALLVAILCLAATPRFAADCTVQLLRTFGNTRREAMTTAIVTVSSIIAIAIGAVTAGIMGAAIALVASAWTVESAIAIFNHRAAKRVVT